MTTITLERLKELCDLYDMKYGEYPESLREGKAVYEWVEERLLLEEKK
jgi:hypothetical protein